MAKATLGVALIGPSNLPFVCIYIYVQGVLTGFLQYFPLEGESLRQSLPDSTSISARLYVNLGRLYLMQNKLYALQS